MSDRRAIALGLIAAAMSETVNVPGWAVITIDDEAPQPNVLCVTGPFDTDRDAAEHAVKLDNDDDRWGEGGWTHLVAPMVEVKR